MKITPDNTLSLASGSPRRKQLLENLGLTLQIISPDVDESRKTGEYAIEMAGRLAFSKAKAVIAIAQYRFVLAADTIVVLDNEPIGKPADSKEAENMLMMLSNRHHEVITGCTIYDKTDNSFSVFTVSTKVWFKELQHDEIADYIATGSPFDKAGGYGIQDAHGSVFINKIEGCYYNVMGLPVSRIITELRNKSYASGH